MTLMVREFEGSRVREFKSLRSRVFDGSRIRGVGVQGCSRVFDVLDGSMV